MYSKRAISTSRRVCQLRRHTSSAFSDLKKLSTVARQAIWQSQICREGAELKLLYSSSDQCGEFRLAQRREDFADDVSLYAAYDFTAGLALGHAPCGIKLCFRVVGIRTMATR